MTIKNKCIEFNSHSLIWFRKWFHTPSVRPYKDTVIQRGNQLRKNRDSSGAISPVLQARATKNMTGHWTDKWRPFRGSACTLHLHSPDLFRNLFSNSQSLVTLDNPWNHLIKQTPSPRKRCCDSLYILSSNSSKMAKIAECLTAFHEI